MSCASRSASCSSCSGCSGVFQVFLAVTSRHHTHKAGLMALSQSLSKYKRAGESLCQLLSSFLAGNMAAHDSTQQRPSKKLMGWHHHHSFCDVCASLQNHQGQPPHLAHTKAPIVPALEPGSSSLQISLLHLSQPKVLSLAPRTKIKNRGSKDVNARGSPRAGESTNVYKDLA